MAKKTGESENKKQAVVKHHELSSPSVLDKMRKAELIDLVISTETRLNEQIDLVALRDVKIEGLEHQVGKLNDTNKAAAKVLDETQELLKKVRGDLSVAQHTAAANKELADDLASQCELLKSLSKREIDECHKKMAEMEAKLSKYRSRLPSFIVRLLDK